jgi:hypothetical protein
MDDKIEPNAADPLSAEQVGKLRLARAFWHGCDSPKLLPYPSHEREKLAQLEKTLRDARKQLAKMPRQTRARLVQFLPDCEMRGLRGVVNQLRGLTKAAAEAKKHRHGSAVLKSGFGTLDYLVIRLLANYFEALGTRATVYWDYDKEKMVGDFLNFVSKAYGQAFEGDAVPSENTIREALRSRAKRTDRQQKAGRPLAGG